MNINKIVKKLTKAFTFCLCCIFCIGVLSFASLTVYGADEPSESGGFAVITDLTNTTWYLPSGWVTTVGNNYTAYSDIGFIVRNADTNQLIFDTSTYFGEDGFYGGIWFGFTGDASTPVPAANSILFVDVYNMTSIAISNNVPLLITFVGGSNATNFELIAWLLDYGTQLKVTNLKDTTWNVAAGWQAEAGYLDGIGIQYDANNNYYTELFIGYSDAYSTSSSNYITFYNMGTENGITISNENAFTISFPYGSETNPKLIAWLSEYGVLLSGPEPEPTTKQFIINKGGIDYTCYFVEGMTLADWANSEYDTLGYALADGYYLFNGEFIEREFVVSSIEQTESCYTVYRCLESKAFEPSYTVITEGDIYYDVVGLVLYNECYGTGYNDGYDNGYSRGEYLGHQTGYGEGYLRGKTEGESSSIGSNLIGSGFSSITEALNRIIVYESSTGTVVTLWVMVSGAIGIALFVWVLKLFAGG